MKFTKSIVVDAGDLPVEVENWCIEQDISTHYEHSLCIFDKTVPLNPLLEWLQNQGVDLREFSNENCYYVSMVGT